MNTFLPYKSFEESAKCLDYRRLGKQRVECLQILNALISGPYQKLNSNKWEPLSEQQYQPFDHFHRKTPWYSHPATQMWKNYKEALIEYGMIMCREWLNRDYKDTVLEKLDNLDWNKEKETIYPPWLGDEKFHLAMKSNLIRKNPEYYRPIFGENIPDNLPYVWKIS